MKTTQNSHFFSRFFLLVFGSIGLILISYYLLTEIEKPEYLVFYAPIFGLSFYAIYCLLQKGFQVNLPTESFPGSSAEI
ncbi:MAG TPA: hypothetical protein PKY12_08440 [Catalimonadaceae bacterium]|jgi:hypothetical protein|nr:hypothetical protein [Catalimonadaceae bacterium]